MSTNKLIYRFDQAAPRYDEAASLQARIAQHLVDWAQTSEAPRHILDLGSGTGFVAAAAKQKWPQAHLTALDQAPKMLQQAQQKIRHLKIVAADAARHNFTPQFDVIFSSMMLHWLPDPLTALRRWQKGLKPEGNVCIALLIEGSFKEWSDLGREVGIKDGLWPMPRADFADILMPRKEKQTLEICYPSAQDFLKRLKSIGAGTARHDHRPLNPSVMRKLLNQAAQPFAVTYQVLYLQIPSPSI